MFSSSEAGSQGPATPPPGTGAPAKARNWAPLPNICMRVPRLEARAELAVDLDSLLKAKLGITLENFGPDMGAVRHQNIRDC